jgi:phage terminase large subunit-like protein
MKRLNIIEAMEHPKLFGPWFEGPSWANWKAILRAAYCLPMTPEEIAFFRTVAERDPPKKRVRELWLCCGRRAGKDSVASLIVAYESFFFDGARKLRRGERALVACFGCDKDQAKIELDYTKSYYDDLAPLKERVRRETMTGFELTNDLDISIVTNNDKSVRGRPILTAVLDECSRYKDQDSATPDVELYRALKPGMKTIAESLLLGISTPYRKSGILFDKFKQSYGRDDAFSSGTAFVECTCARA